jgi:hypothetical protein
MRDFSLSGFWAWYHRIGEPLEFYSSLSIQDCMERLNQGTVSWDTRNPFGVKKYKSLILYDGQFKLKSRRNPADRPFVGKLESTHDGKTRVTGRVVNETSYPAFVGFLLVAAPLVGWYFYGRGGLMIGFLIALLLAAVGIYARVVEEHNHAAKQIQAWLVDTLEASPHIIEANNHKIVIRR